jgi:hypothetical protein
MNNASLRRRINLPEKDNLDSYLRHFAKEEAFYFKAPTLDRPANSACQAVRFRPRRRPGTTYFDAERPAKERRLKLLG